MTEPTPIEQLDNAVHDFFRALETAELMEPGTFVTSWAVVASTARIQAEDGDKLPRVDGARYALGPSTSVVQAAGLAEFLRVVVERANWQMLNEE